MNYVRKVMAVGLAILFLTALVIGTGIILSIRNVNVTFIDCSGKYTEEYEATRSNLDKLRGSGLLFVGDEEVNEKVSDVEVLKIDGYEKVFPCTLNVVVKERVESFAIKTEAGYSVYDEDGKFVKSSAGGEASLLNTVDGCPNVILNVEEKMVEKVAGLCSYIDKYFGSLRRTVESVSLKNFFEVEIAAVSLRSGVTVSVSNWQTDGERKIKKAYEAYSKLSDSQKTTGMITVADGKDNSGPVADYGA